MEVGVPGQQRQCVEQQAGDIPGQQQSGQQGFESGVDIGAIVAPVGREIGAGLGSLGGQ